jgi:hypothetical protein
MQELSWSRRGGLLWIGAREVRDDAIALPKLRILAADRKRRLGDRFLIVGTFDNVWQPSNVTIGIEGIDAIVRH